MPLVKYLLMISSFGFNAAAQTSSFAFDDKPMVVTRPVIKPAIVVGTEPGVPPVSGTRPSGPGGQMQDCGIPPGPVAYNIGNPAGTGIGSQCSPRSVVVGFQGSFSSLPRGTVGMGYINPRLENKSMVDRFPGDTRVIGDEWNEPVYRDYGSSAAINYIAYQANHWKKQGAARGQKCVAVDIDNCDVIGAQNYGKVLDVIDDLNRKNPEVQIRVLVKNPQNEGCGQFLKRSVAVGAFMEELSSSDFERLKVLRANPNQLLVFARGNNRTPRSHISMDAIAEARVSNTTVSFDSDGSYKSINKCTFTGGPTVTGAAQAPTAVR